MVLSLGPVSAEQDSPGHGWPGGEEAEGVPGLGV